MGRKLRVFISSTMKDLANERLAVAQRLELFNFEPVNAENLGPSGGNSWQRIQPEIASSDAMILILGERYGWIPQSGPGAEAKVSVTELEVLEARKCGIPVLPFVKRLGEDADRTSEDAKKRDEFRKRIKDWDTSGLFVQEFDWAPDLADKAGKALITMLSDTFQTDRISAHAATVRGLTGRESIIFTSNARLFVPDRLREAVKTGSAMLFAGSGISLSAGLPSAAAFTERFVQLIEEKQPGYSLSPAASAFAATATDLESLRGRNYVTGAIRTLMHPPQHPAPTPSHEYAVRLFSRIVTTNYDMLFEKALETQGLKTAVVVSEIENDLPTGPVVVKLHGSCDAPGSLMINERDIIFFDRLRPRLWQAVQRLLRELTLVVVGSSVRDPSVLRLFAEAKDRPQGYFIGPRITSADHARLQQLNLECIEASSDDFMAALAIGS